MSADQLLACIFVPASAGLFYIFLMFLFIFDKDAKKILFIIEYGFICEAVVTRAEMRPRAVYGLFATARTPDGEKELENILNSRLRSKVTGLTGTTHRPIGGPTTTYCTGNQAFDIGDSLQVYYSSKYPALFVPVEKGREADHAFFDFRSIAGRKKMRRFSFIYWVAAFVYWAVIFGIASL